MYRALSFTLLALLFLCVAYAVQHEPFRDTHIPLYVINLEKRPDRLRQFATRNRKVRWQRIDAVDGRNVDLGGVRTKLTKGEVGCFLSHIKALDVIARGQDDFAIVLEDDASITFPESFPIIERLLAEALAVMPGFGAIALGYNAFPGKTKRITNTLYASDRSSDMYGAQAILYSRRGAAALVAAAHSKGFSDPYDLWISRTNAIDLLIAHPSLSTVQNYMDSDTQNID
jgi:glycosyl transferase family 25